MRILEFAIKNLLHRKGSSFLTLALFSFGLILTLGLLKIQNAFQGALERQTGGIQFVIGSKGSNLQTVLSSIFHVDNPTGNILHEDFLEYKDHPLIKTLIPISIGDSYRGNRIVGTDSNLLQQYNIQLKKGVSFMASGDLIISETLALKHKLKLGNQVVGQHGIAEGEGHHHEHELSIVGIFKNTGTPIDQVILTPLITVWESHHMHDHLEITAALGTFRNPLAMMQFPRFINSSTPNSCAVVQYELDRLLVLFEKGTVFIFAIILCIILFAVVSAVINALTSALQKKELLKQLRWRGAQPWEIGLLLILENVVLFLCAFILALPIHYGLMALIQFEFPSLSFSFLGYWQWDSIALVSCLLLGGISGGLPLLSRDRR
ncbi:MAG: putative ABC transport system permease protein [Sphingobacteriales bacterium]|jgi:putative ABC transport system permease protein